MAGKTIGDQFRALLTAIEFEKDQVKSQIGHSEAQMNIMSPDSQLYAFEMGQRDASKRFLEILERWSNERK